MFAVKPGIDKPSESDVGDSGDFGVGKPFESDVDGFEVEVGKLSVAKVLTKRSIDYL